MSLFDSIEYWTKLNSWYLEEAACLSLGVTPKQHGGSPKARSEILEQHKSAKEIFNVLSRAYEEGQLKGLGGVGFTNWGGIRVEPEKIIKRASKLGITFPAELSKRVNEINEQKDSIKENSFSPISEDNEIDWRDIKISFLSDFEIHIQFKSQSVTRRYDQCGFDDKRNYKPIDAWHIFKEAADKREIPYNYETRKRVEKKAQVIRKRMRTLFPNIEGDPVPLNKKNKCYEFSFRLVLPVD